MAAAVVGGAGIGGHEGRLVDPPEEMVVVDRFDRSDSLYHGDGWESLNPGFWKIENGRLRRRLRNLGDRARATGFPYHWETHQQRPMPIEYDPSLPFGMLWHRDYRLSGNYRVRVTFTVKAHPPAPTGGNRHSGGQWRQFQKGYALFGVCFGGRSLHEGWHGRGKPGTAAWMAVWRDDATFGIYDHASDVPNTVQRDSHRPAPQLAPGDEVTIDLHVAGTGQNTADVTATLSAAGESITVHCQGVDREQATGGYFGVVCRGLLDFEVNRVEIDSAAKRIDTPLNELHVAYPLGDTLKQVNGQWQCRWIALFRNDGREAEIRISDTPEPAGGWAAVPVAGSAKIINNDFRRNTAVIDATLPADPSEKTLYYTVWKDGRDVTSDPRTGLLGRKEYVGRLPCLQAPYRLCGLSCHAINSTCDLPDAGLFQENWLHDQPTADAYKHLEDYNFQVMLWEDDVWYLELVLFPPSTDDAYKIITLTLAGPTTRWQMMRHWNVLNPGDHDYGMDDVKGPEQLAVRNHSDLGQDTDYLRRNFQIVSHLISGDENPSPNENPKRWRRWKMPRGDFSLLIMDSRLWRSSQDTHIWDDEGWGHKSNLYGRDDPTRSLLGEEQFAWLQQVIRTDSSPLICLTGINGLHTIWSGDNADPDAKRRLGERDRVAADYAGWVKAGADRVIELLGSRDGVVSVYGDVHNGCILRNDGHGLYECSFGPIGRYGGRDVKEGFGPRMKDFDGRELHVVALYHQRFMSPELHPLVGPRYWNFLEMNFDPQAASGNIGLRIRNLIDPPAAEPRGGGQVDASIGSTGRPIDCRLPPVEVLPNAAVQFTLTDGTPVRATHSRADGTLPLAGLVGVASGTAVVVTSFNGQNARTEVVRTLEL